MKNLLINRPIVSLIEPPLNIFFRLFCLATEDLCNDGAIGGEDSSIAIMQKNKIKIHYFIHNYVKK